jgi:hypothetical protein
MRGPFSPQLYGVFEAQLPRRNIGIQCGLRHQQTDQVIGEKMNPQLLLDRPWREAAQDFDAQGGFDVAKIQLHIPALRVQLVERAIVDFALVQQRGNQDLAIDPHLSYRQFVGKSIVVFCDQPLGSDLRFRTTLAVLRQARLRHFEQLRSGEQIEKTDCIDALRASANLLSVLLGRKLGITLSQGWPWGWFGGCLVTNIVPIPVNLPHTFQPLSLAHSCRSGQSKCHSL